MDFETLVKELAARGVKVRVSGNYSARKERMTYSANVAPDFFINVRSLPTFEFTVYGRDVVELATEIEARLHLVEPIIAMLEVDRKSRPLLNGEKSINDARATAGYAPLEPNMDAATALERPVL